MRTFMGIMFGLQLLTTACAPGYYERGAAYQSQGVPYYESQHLYRNPETQEEYERRIWQEESRP
jgi:hypothetical protein